MVSRTSSSYRFNLSLLLALLMLPFLFAAGCGKKAAPFLSGPREKIDLELKEAVIRGNTLSLTVRIPRESYSLGKEEEPWSLVRVLRRKTDGAETLEERRAYKEGGGFPFGAWRTFEDEGLGGGPYLYLVEARKRDSRDLAVSELLSVRVTAAPSASDLSAREGGAIALSWSAPEGSAMKMGFDLFRRGPGESDYTGINREPLTSNSYTDIEVTSGAEFCYRVRAFIGDGPVRTEGPWTEESCALVEEMVRPEPR